MARSVIALALLLLVGSLVRPAPARAQQSGILGKDGFNRPDQQGLGTSETGLVWRSDVGGDAFSLVSGAAQWQGDARAMLQVQPDIRIPNFTIELTLTLYVDNMLVMYRYQNDNNLLSFATEFRSTNRYNVTTRINGQWQAVQTSNVVAQSGDQLKIVVTGPTAQLFVNGALVLSYTDSALADAGQVGFGGNPSAPQRVDNFVVYDTSAPEPTPTPTAITNCGLMQLVTVPAEATDPRLVASVATKWQAARSAINTALGYSTGEYGNDWLAKQPSDIMRPISFVPTQSNQTYYSWHKTGRAVDIPQRGPGLVHTADTSAPGYDLFYLRSKAGQLISITNIMLAAGFARIPSTPNRPEWWHFEDRSSNGVELGWQGAMSQIYSQQQLEQQYPEKNWSDTSINCSAPDPDEPIPDLVAPVRFSIPNCEQCSGGSSIIIPAEDPPAEPGTTDFIGRTLYPFHWLGWAFKASIRELMCLMLRIAGDGAQIAEDAVNALIKVLNGIWRLGINSWLGITQIFYALFASLELLRIQLNDLSGLPVVMRAYAESLWQMLLAALVLVGDSIGMVATIGSMAIGLVGYVSGFLIGLITTFQSALASPAAPAELAGRSVVYEVIHGAGRGFRDSALGWVLVLVWGMVYVGAGVWAIRYFSGSGPNEA